MNVYIKLTVALILGALPLFCLNEASARGGAANIINSPGYQRALKESRKRYQQSYSERYRRSPTSYSRNTLRHRNRHQ
ncbi:hypothetical protein YH63_016710 [Afipia massiliensis]|uniref:DUF4148 domain-containing protein n=1 Tax=Afipia massiliensis TaxID=211460 RepID=A0A4U6BR10_9BRAD|nr:hypothetical protein YH63_016710 [Afipia massiliensis]